MLRYNPNYLICTFFIVKAIKIFIFEINNFLNCGPILLDNYRFLTYLSGPIVLDKSLKLLKPFKTCPCNIPTWNLEWIIWSTWIVDCIKNHKTSLYLLRKTPEERLKAKTRGRRLSEDSPFYKRPLYGGFPILEEEELL